MFENITAVVLSECWFMIKKIDLRWATRLEEINDPLGPGRVMGEFSSSCRAIGKQTAQSHIAEPCTHGA